MKRRKPRMRIDPRHAALWAAVVGGLRDFQNAHPGEIDLTAQRETSIAKRIVGSVLSAAERWSAPAPSGPAASGETIIASTRLGVSHSPEEKADEAAAPRPSTRR